MWHDVRYGIRILVRKPAFAVTAIFILGLGVGVNILVFSVIDAVLLRPLPYPNPNQLVWISQGVSPINKEYVLAPDFVAWRTQTRSFSYMAAFSQKYRNLRGKGEPERVLTAQVSADFFRVLGIQPARGRDFIAQEDTPGNNRVAIITHGFWMRHFAAGSSDIQETIKLDDEPIDVIGVLPKDFNFPEPLDVEIVTPLALGRDQSTREAGMQSGMTSINVIARLGQAVSLDQAQTELDSVQQAIVQAYPTFQEGEQVKLQLLQEHLVGSVRRATLVLLGAVCFLCLLSCLNVGSLLLVRTISRRTETAIRIALGADRLTVLRQFLTENAVITFLGCLLGILTAFWGRSLLFSIIPKAVFGINNTQVDVRILGFIIVSFIVTTLLISLISGKAVASRNIAQTLKSGSASVIGSSGLRRIMDTIVIGELALAVVLLIAAGLMIRSFWLLRYGDIVFSPDRVLTLRIDLTPSRYSDRTRQSHFFEGLLQRLATLPGVDSAALCSSAPPIPATASFLVSLDQQVSSKPVRMMAKSQAVSSEYFRAMRIPVVDGEVFSDRDREGTAMVAMVNRAFISKYLESDQAVGKRIKLGGSPWLTIVGVVENFKNAGLASEPEPEVYRPYRQFPFLGSVNLIVRTSTTNPLTFVPAIRQETWALDPEQPVAEVQTLNERLTASVAQPRFTMSLLIGFALLALILAAAGVYGVMSYSSQQRNREIAIRLALGAEPNQVIWMMVREGLLRSVLGLSVGLISAFAASRLLSSLLYGVTPSDPYTFIVTLILLIFIAIVGCYLPAYRATKVEAIEVLRYE